MTKLHALFTVLAGLHLFLVICGATKRPLLPRELPANSVLRFYGAVSGSDSSYGFFAPEVGPQLRAVFVLTDDVGKTWTDTLNKNLNREAALRAGCTVAVFGLPELSPETRKELLVSWAAYILARHPAAESVVIRIEVFNPPAMDDFQEGTEAEWTLLDQFGPYSRTETSTAKNEE